MDRPVRELNLELGRPDAAEALRRLAAEVEAARKMGTPAMKLIHGYGSSGKGGALKTACQKLCTERQRSGMIRHFVRGEDFTPFTDAGRKAIEICPQLKTDADFGRQNDGITIILF